MSLLWSCFSSATISFIHIMLLPFRMLLLLSGICSALDSYICFQVTFKVLVFWSFFLSATCVSSLCHLPSNGSFCNQRPPPTSCSCLGTFVCRIESPLYLKSFISLAKPLDQFLRQMLMLQWSQPIFLFRPWWGFSWNPNWVLFLHSHLLSFDNGVIISGTQRSTNQRLWSTGFTTAKMLTLWIGSSFWTLTKSYDTLLLPGRLELKKADLWQLNMGE